MMVVIMRRRRRFCHHVALALAVVVVGALLLCVHGSEAAPRTRELEVVFPLSDDQVAKWTHLLTQGQVEEVTLPPPSSPGTSVRFEVVLKDPATNEYAKAIWKPSFGISDATQGKEVKAFEISEYIGMRRVPVVVARGMVFRDLVAAYSTGKPPLRQTGTSRARANSTSLAEVLNYRGDNDGVLEGVLQMYVPNLRALSPSHYSHPHRYKSADTIVPYELDPVFFQEQPFTKYADYESFLSMVLFDFLIANVDRQSAGNSVVQPDGKMVLIDHTSALMFRSLDFIINMASGQEGPDKVCKEFMGVCATMTGRVCRFNLVDILRLKDILEREGSRAFVKLDEGDGRLATRMSKNGMAVSTAVRDRSAFIVERARLCTAEYGPAIVFGKDYDASLLPQGWEKVTGEVGSEPQHDDL